MFIHIRIPKVIMVTYKGLYNGIAGPTLPDLRDRLGVTQEQISRVLMGRTLGFMIGAIIGGFLFR